MPQETIKVTSEEQLLDEAIRKKVLEGFLKCESASRRKEEAFKGYDCLKDHTSNFVLQNLLKQFNFATVCEMQYSISNISILRKVIDKLAKVYANGVKRTIGADKPQDPTKLPTEEEKKSAKEVTDELEKAAKLLGVDAAMRKVDRYYRTFKNALLYVRPQKEAYDEEQYCVRLEVKAPFNYDVVEDPSDPTKAMAVVLSDFVPSRQTLYYLGDAAHAGREGNTRVVRQMDQIAEVSQSYSPSAGPVQDGEKDTREFVWWSKNYHFTTDSKGKIVDGKTDIESGMENPIHALPFINFCGDQDNGFWADGGQDLIDAGIKINTMITNADHIGVTQGYGQLYMTGKNLPKNIQTGPNHCIQLAQSEGEPNPTVGFLQANPPLEELKLQIEMAVALMLSTNNLSRAGFSTSLSQGKDFASGIAMMIDRSESIEDINEQALLFIEKEPEMWELIGAWLEYYGQKKLLTDELAGLSLPIKDLERVQLSIEEPQPIQSEGENLDNLLKRKNLGISTMLDLIMLDNPGMTQAQAEEKLEKIKAEKVENMAMMGLDPNAPPMEPAAGDKLNGSKPNWNGAKNADQGKGGGGFGQQNSGRPGPGATGKNAGSGQGKG